MNTSIKTKKKVKDPYLQVSESFFEKEEIMDIISRYGYQGIGIYIKICIMLVKNEGKMKYDCNYFSTKKSEQKIVEDIINNSGLFQLENNGTYFSSPNVSEQLEERGKISEYQSKRVQKRWDKTKSKEEIKVDSNTTLIEDLDNIELNKGKNELSNKWSERNKNIDFDLLDGIKK